MVSKNSGAFLVSRSHAPAWECIGKISRTQGMGSHGGPWEPETRTGGRVNQGIRHRSAGSRSHALAWECIGK